MDDRIKQVSWETWTEPILHIFWYQREQTIPSEAMQRWNESSKSSTTSSATGQHSIYSSSNNR